MAKKKIWHIGLSTQQTWDKDAGTLRVDIIKAPSTTTYKGIYRVIPGSASFKRILRAMQKFIGGDTKQDSESECAYCGTKEPGNPCRKCGAQN